MATCSSPCGGGLERAAIVEAVPFGRGVQLLGPDLLGGDAMKREHLGRRQRLVESNAAPASVVPYNGPEQFEAGSGQKNVLAGGGEAVAFDQHAGAGDIPDRHGAARADGLEGRLDANPPPRAARTLD